jgi:signal transduction histidine kinase
MMITSERLDLAKVVQDTVASMSADAERAGCTVDVAFPGAFAGALSGTFTARCDRVRVEQVLRNLLSNAMKFGAGRPIEVTGESTAENVRISVRDHGVGLSPEDQSRIFARFERAVSTRHYGGLGLGLYISAQIVRAHNGSLRVESQPGDGACFIVELPRNVEKVDDVDIVEPSRVPAPVATMLAEPPRSP